MNVTRLSDVPILSGTPSDSGNVILNYTNSTLPGTLTLGKLVDELALYMLQYIYGND